jgi:phosphatidylserine/phosphatidylglycerophosphate/cardiolipin synthase-like enzyme
MIDVISNHNIPSEILNIIQLSQKYVVIVSPYIKLWEHLTLQLKSSIKRGVLIKWYYRTNEVKPKIIDELKDIGVQMKNIDNLHTKLYLSEDFGMISSMNLYEFSSTSSQEIGLVSDERKILNKFKFYIEEELTMEPIIPKRSFLDMGKDFLVNQLTDDEVEEKVETKKSYKPTFKRTQSNGDGHCIRCSTSIPYNVKSPYCKKCYSSWNKYKNKDYKEKHCHQCSKSHKTSFEKPICYSCFKSN